MSIVTPIRRPQQRMNMELLRLLISQKDTRMVIKLDKDNRALDTEIKWIVVSKPANPAEIRLGFKLADVVEFHGSGYVREVEEVLLEDAVEEALLLWSE